LKPLSSATSQLGPAATKVRAAHQQITREWWQNHRSSFETVASEIVLREISSGDPSAARERLQAIADLRLLALTEAATELGEELVRRGALPRVAAVDALHVAISATNGIAYLLTWNCRHLANAAMRDMIDSVCIDRGFRPPTICTPEALMEGADDEG
jgi:hypothetical protein